MGRSKRLDILVLALTTCQKWLQSSVLREPMQSDFKRQRNCARLPNNPRGETESPYSKSRDKQTRLKIGILVLMCRKELSRLVYTEDRHKLLE